MKERTTPELPSAEQLKGEIERVRYKKRYRSVFMNTVYLLLGVAAAAVLIATLLMPILRIYGSSMYPLLSERDIVVTVKTDDFERGDIVSFYYNNKVLVKRVMAMPGEWIDLDEEGNVFVNGVPYDEPYLTEKHFGECDITLPYQVPEGRIFVMGDNRESSIDSRNTAVGPVYEEQIVGKILFRVWPFESFGPVK